MSRIHSIPIFSRVIRWMVHGSMLLPAPLFCANGWASDAWLNALFTRDSLRWRIPHPNEKSDFHIKGDSILSELKWQPLRGVGLEGGIRMPLGHPKALFIAQGQITAIYAGHGRDSDWAGPNFSLEYSRSISQARGWTATGQAMLGWRFGPASCSFSPLVGLDGAFIRLREKGLRQLFGLEYDELWAYADEEGVLSMIRGEIEAYVHFKEGDPERAVGAYDVNWLGALLGAEIMVQPSASLRLQLLGWGSLGHYDADADWILRECYQHPRSFAHNAKTTTWDVEGGIYWQITSRLGLNLRGGARQAWASEGCERIFLVDEDGTPSEMPNRFSDLDWKRIWASIGLLVVW